MNTEQITICNISYLNTYIYLSICLSIYLSIYLHMRCGNMRATRACISALRFLMASSIRPAKDASRRWTQKGLVASRKKTHNSIQEVAKLSTIFHNIRNFSISSTDHHDNLKISDAVSHLWQFICLSQLFVLFIFSTCLFQSECSSEFGSALPGATVGSWTLRQASLGHLEMARTSSVAVWN